LPQVSLAITHCGLAAEQLVYGTDASVDDQVNQVVQAGIGPKDELFSRYTTIRGKRSLKRLGARGVRANIKRESLEASLDPKFFSGHSLRKAAQTHMSAPVSPPQSINHSKTKR
jgi:hypothetical protein